MVVIVFHWQFWGNDENRLEPSGGFPLYRALAEGCLQFFYQCGASAVALFFTLSGFVFYWLFRDDVNAGKLSGWRFFVDRFSRLYPLHVATLIVVAIEQCLYAPMNHGLGWSNPTNTMSNFLKQLMVVPLWTRTRTIEFNLPVWSLVVEAFAYLAFFTVARRVRLGVAGSLAMVAFGLAVNRYSPDLSYGLTSFFMGGLAYVIFERLDDRRFERPLAILVVASWALAVTVGSGLLSLAGTPFASLDHVYAVFVMFPVTVLYLAILETRRGPTGTRWSWLGDATYSMYLLGFPLMLALALALRSAGLSFDGVKSPLAILVFLGVAIPVALASHRYFERPMQALLRRRLLNSADSHACAVT